MYLFPFAFPFQYPMKRGEKINSAAGEEPAVLSVLQVLCAWLPPASHPGQERITRAPPSSRRPDMASTPQPRVPDCFTSCCQEFSTLRLTSTPFFQVLCFFQVYGHYTAAENVYKSGANFTRRREGRGLRCPSTRRSQKQVNVY